MIDVSYRYYISSSTYSSVGMFTSFDVHIQLRAVIEGECFDGNMSQVYHS